MALLALSFVAVMSYAAGRRYVRAAAAVRHTLAVRIAIEDTLSLIKDAETGQRGFLLTNDPAFLAPYESAGRHLAEQMATLASATQNDREESQGTQRIQVLAARKLEELSLTIRLARQGHLDDALTVVRSGEGRRLMVEIRDEVNHMLAREEVALVQREREAARGERWAGFMLLVGMALTAALVSGGLFMARQDVAAARLISLQLSDSENKFRLLADSTGDLVRILDEGGHTTYVSPSCESLLGYLPRELLALPPGALQHPEEVAFFTAQAKDLAISRQATTGFTHRLRHKNGEYRWFETHIQPALHQPDGKPRIHIASRDVTAQRRTDQALRESERRWRILSESSFEGVAITGAGQILDANANLAAWVGQDLSELAGMDELNLFAPEDRDHVHSQSQEDATLYEARMLRKNGTTFPVEVRGRLAEFQGQSVRLAVVRDITERKRQEAATMRDAEKLRALSLRDQLTRLYNRRGFLELARQQLIGLTHGQRGAALFFADLDGMKAINDGFGHDLGDHAIVATAKILVGSFRGSDIIARLGGDEFAILAPECDAGGILAARARVQRAVDEANARGDQPYQLSVSLGAAIFDPRAPVALEALMEAADERTYQQKRAQVLARASAASPNDPAGRVLPS